MERIVINGGHPLRGTVRVSGAKNSSLAVMVAACLAPDVSVLENVPHCQDVLTLSEILQGLGVRIDFAGGRMVIDARELRGHRPAYDLVRRMRASFYTAGLLLGRLGRAEVPLPGGCSIGSRPVDFHMRGFAALGAEVTTEHGYMKATLGRRTRLRATQFYVPRSSVGTTINLMMAASLARGTTRLQNAAREPEVVDTAVFLNLMGARVRGAGTDTITIQGVPALHGAQYAIIPDRIEAGTYLLCGVATGGDVQVAGLIPEHLQALLAKLAEAGAEILVEPDGVRVRVTGELSGVDVDTAPYPGFATDLHPPLVAALTRARGVSTVRETIYESRFGYVDELRRLGADIRLDGDTVHVHGVPTLTGAPVEALDIRAGAAVVIGGLAATGTTEVSGIENIDRGYEGMVAKLRGLGAQVFRVGGEVALEVV
ncbi:MAG: UDP-N-acetylglucosamine 1-carboxyvinyltransferase [Armatimonadota bacterium]|nr:UDP-N-acetylglucosamine 1-carboxyvinyltransferase [Armatimonadota bacterium]MDR7449464.1 UDP-N-acetylglucosamine 1-carboxyvinyltransferase [Armatimonadota bacterium]MDR7460005.1 UDP-N-acetylglucosamine 1-carboxyvinyltransferase [Armatimonadota bacterium]MDR7480662.1 UDP-N-acetylglucosamine 1-carboxyvinyltransferase [Armatimonadota bacterium]MDR7489182.1 UDP-N-acetylglucosamine 1-carboxyvinyltransferase [Armatimonadota bacterium]